MSNILLIGGSGGIGSQLKSDLKKAEKKYETVMTEKVLSIKKIFEVLKKLEMQAIFYGTKLKKKRFIPFQKPSEKQRKFTMKKPYFLQKKKIDCLKAYLANS